MSQTDRLTKATQDQSQHQNTRTKVRLVEIDERSELQRLDNFLIKTLKPPSKSLIYKIIRKGEVRVNKKRAKPDYKLRLGDVVRIPPVNYASDDSFDEGKQHKAPKWLLDNIRQRIIYEDDDLLVINKPAGLAVHGGSKQAHGLIESLKSERQGFIELAHRLDKDTCGIVLLALNRPTLTALHKRFKQSTMNKYYTVLVFGVWRKGRITLTQTLHKQSDSKQKIRVDNDLCDADGKTAVTHVRPLQQWGHVSLLEVKIDTGRMHQIRVQLADAGHPVVGDSKYGDFNANRALAKHTGFKRLFLQASRSEFKLNDRSHQFQVPLDDELQALLDLL